MKKHLSAHISTDEKSSQIAESQPNAAIEFLEKNSLLVIQTTKTKEFLESSARLPDDCAFRAEFLSWEQPDIG